MKTKNKIAALLAIPIMIAGAYISDKAALYLEKKEVAAEFAQIDITQKSYFIPSELEKLANGEDIVPGLPEEGAMCSKYVRAVVNTLLGSKYFKHHRLHSKIACNILGIDSLRADILGINGSGAWHMYDNIQNAGGTEIYSTETPIDSAERSEEWLRSKAQIGDIIGLYYPDSQYNEEAKKTDAGFTHMGYIVGFEESGEPIITHMMHLDNYMLDEEIMRTETLQNITDKLIFKGYIKPLDYEKTEDHEYKEGDQLVYIKSILRPDYSLLDKQ